METETDLLAQESWEASQSEGGGAAEGRAPGDRQEATKQRHKQEAGPGDRMGPCQSREEPGWQGQWKRWGQWGRWGEPATWGRKRTMPSRTEPRSLFHVS